MKRVFFLLLTVIFAMALLAGCKSSAPASSDAPASSSGSEASGESESSGSENASSQENAPEVDRTADYSTQFEDVVLNVAFISEAGFRVSNPAEEMTPEESEERAEKLDPPATREVYAGDECVFRFYFYGSPASSMQGLPTFYEQKLAKAQADGTLYEQGENDLYEYFFYERTDPRDEGAITYGYMSSFKEYPTYGFQAYSPVSREEAEKQFEAMKLWFTKPTE